MLYALFSSNLRRGGCRPADAVQSDGRAGRLPGLFLLGFARGAADRRHLRAVAPDVDHDAHLGHEQQQAGAARGEEGQADAGVGQGVGDDGHVAEHLPATWAMMPTPTRVLKRSPAWKAIMNPCTSSSTNSRMTTTAPTKPSSSQTTLKIKSLVHSGSQSCFSTLLPRPRPVSPPEPMAYRLCRVWSVILLMSLVQPSSRSCR